MKQPIDKKKRHLAYFLYFSLYSYQLHIKYGGRSNMLLSILLFFFKLTTILTNSFYCNIELELARNERLDTNSFLKKKRVSILRFISWLE